MNNSKIQGIHKQNYVPSLQGANPVKEDKEKNDWWDEMCQKHKAKNHWKKNKPKNNE